MAENKLLEMKNELLKVDQRQDCPEIKSFEFLFEEYEPRYYLFPVFELVRRLFLSSVLAVFYPGSMQQVVVGLLGAMLSYVVYSYCDAYISNDDDVVAAVAQGQLVLIYFAALAIYTSDVADQKRGVFSNAAFGLLLVLLFLASFIVGAYVTLLEFFGDSEIKRTVTRISACLYTAPAPVACLKPQPSQAQLEAGEDTGGPSSDAPHPHDIELERIDKTDAASSEKDDDDE